MISASSAARLMASIVASTLMMLPLRVPRFAAAPLPMTSRAAPGFCSPMRTQIFEVPISQATRKDSGFDINAPRFPSETIPCAVSAHENQPIGKTEIDDPRLPPATLHETPRIQQRPNLARGVRTENANRFSKDRIHHTESPVGERGDFRERRDVLGQGSAEVFEKCHGFRKSAALTGQNDVFRSVPARIVGGDQVSLGAHPPETSLLPEEGDGLALGHADRETIGKALGQRRALDPGLSGHAARDRREVEGDEVGTSPRGDDAEDVFGARARVSRNVEAAERKARPREELPDAEGGDESEDSGSGQAQRPRTTGLARRSGARPEERRFPLVASHGAGTPRRTSRRLRRPVSGADPPA